MIKPTVGRVVWYWRYGARGEHDQPRAAIISHVWSDTCVNLLVITPNGGTESNTSVLLIQDGNPVPDGGNYCEWMPYQKGQAAKTEAAEAASRPA